MWDISLRGDAILGDLQSNSMASFTAIIVLIGLFCFPITVIVRGLRSGRLLVYVLLALVIISVFWGYLDSLPSSGTRYSALSYAAALALSAYLYFRSISESRRTSFMNGQVVGSVIRENARHLIIAAAVAVAGFIYAYSNRYQAIFDKSRDRVLILDRWTGDVKTKY
jgi:hypothetical protein